MKFRVCGVYGLKQTIDQMEATAVVSIGAPEEWRDAEPALTPFTGQVCRLEFADVPVHIGNAVPPFPNDLRKAAAFLEELPRDARVIVHCHAGISRSPAMAIFLAAWHGLRILGEPVEEETAQRYFDAGLRMAPGAMPLGRIIEIADSLLPELDGGLRQAWVKDRDAKRLISDKAMASGKLLMPW